MKKFFLYLIINIERWLDHITRQLHGTPNLKTSQITADIYLGGQYQLKAINFFKKVGITTIINMRTKPIPTEIAQNFVTLHLPTPDLQAPTVPDLRKGVALIKKTIDNNEKVYVHCRLGEGRGPTMVAAYLISIGLNLKMAFEQIKKVRRFINPTKEQLSQLKKFEKVVS
jgi:dual specificity MAP kinase phosphatase